MHLDKKVLRVLLLAGGLYFLLVSIAHLSGVKYPGLYLYFNVPSTGYQDRIISLLAFGWSVFFFSGTANPKDHTILRAILIAGSGAIIGLIIINLTTNFEALNPDINVSIFWMETVLLFSYWISLVLFYYRSRHG